MIQKKFNSNCFWLGFILLVLGILGFDLSSVEQFTCNREQNECILKERHLWERDFQEKEHIKLSDIISVDLIHRHRRGGSHHKAFIPEIRIEAKGKNITVFRSMCNPFVGLFIVNDAKRLNTYLNSSEQYLVIKNNFISVLFLPLLCIVLAIFCMLQTCRFTKVEDKKYSSQKDMDKARQQKLAFYVFGGIIGIFLIGLINDLLLMFFIYKY